jgi:hypothetical protein
MLAVLVFLAVGLTLVSINQRYIKALLRLEHARSQAEAFDQGPREVMAMSLELLETGLPPANPYTCGATLETSDGRRTFLVVFNSSGDGTWSVQVAPADDGAGLEPMPISFAERGS